jgi:hypothetical protein
MLGAFVGAFVAALAFASVPAQAAKERPQGAPRASDNQAAQAAPAPAASPAQAPNARLAGLIRRTGAVLRNKGIAAVRRIDTGVFCITPTAASGITPNNAIVMLTPEYFYTLYNEVKVQWAFSGSGCGARRIGVYTFADANLDGIYTPSNAVSFSIIVP